MFLNHNLWAAISRCGVLDQISREILAQLSVNLCKDIWIHRERLRSHRGNPRSVILNGTSVHVPRSVGEVDNTSLNLRSTSASPSMTSGVQPSPWRSNCIAFMSAESNPTKT